MEYFEKGTPSSPKILIKPFKLSPNCVNPPPTLVLQISNPPPTLLATENLSSPQNPQQATPTTAPMTHFPDQLVRIRPKPRNLLYRRKVTLRTKIRRPNNVARDCSLPRRSNLERVTCKQRINIRA